MPFLIKGGADTVAIPAGQSIAIGAIRGSSAQLLIPSGLPGGPIGIVNNSTQTFGPYVNGATVSVSAVTGTVEYVIGISPVLTDGFTQAVSLTGLPFSNDLRLAKWRLALAKARNGISGARVLMCGDSTTVGTGAGIGGATINARQFSTPVKLSALISTYLTKSVRSDSILGSSSTPYGTYDPRFVFTGTWSTGSALNNAIGGGFGSTAPGSVVSYTPSVPWDTAKVYYAINSSQGTFSGDINGASPVTVNALNATPSLGVATFTSSSVGLNVLNITKLNSSANYILGIIISDSTVTAVDVIQAGAAGKKSDMFAAATNPWDGQNEIKAYAPDLTVVNLAINDWAAGTALGDSVTPGTYIYQIQQIITAAKISGDVILRSPVPSQASTVSLAVQQTYVDALSTLAASNSVVFYDGWRRWISRESIPAFYYDNLHPNALGYADDAQGLFAMMAGS